MTFATLVLITSLIGNVLSIFLSIIAIWQIRKYLKAKVEQNLRNLKERL